MMKWASAVSASGALQKICLLHSVSKFGACKKSVYGIHRAISVSGRGASQKFCVAFTEQVSFSAHVPYKKPVCGIHRASPVCGWCHAKFCVALTEQVRFLLVSVCVPFKKSVWQSPSKSGLRVVSCKNSVWHSPCKFGFCACCLAKKPV